MNLDDGNSGRHEDVGKMQGLSISGLLIGGLIGSMVQKNDASENQMLQDASIGRGWGKIPLATAGRMAIRWNEQIYAKYSERF